MPQFQRRWWLVHEAITVVQELDKPTGWGKSYFWYCSRCGQRYALAPLVEYPTLRAAPFQALSGTCVNCRSDKWNIAGTLEALDLIGWKEVPEQILQYQLQRELNFLDSPQHPYNEKE